MNKPREFDAALFEEMRTLLPTLLEGGDTAGLDASTRSLLARLRKRD